jgi:hypothetical protein
VLELKNAWIDDSKSYQGVNSTWHNPEDGTLFEVQVHTSASWTAKQRCHTAYEIIESQQTPPAEKLKALEAQRNLFAIVPIPPAVATIASYRKEGW